jgi:RNA polymerase sigma factor (sigma-70 family)
MTEAQSDVVLRHVRALAGPPPEEATDGQLLERFAARREEAAFEALVRRHGRLVLGVCRRVLGHEHDAEDAFQATFLVLARNAGSIRRRDAVSAWLYGVAYQIAGAARAKSARQRRHEHQAPLPPTPGDEVLLRELQRVLDEELNRLPERYRAPLVLCCLAGKTQQQAAMELGWPAGSMARWLARGKELLRERLARRGVLAPAVVLGAALAPLAEAAPIVSPALLHAASLAASGQTTAGVMTATACALYGGFIKAMWIKRMTTVAAALLALAVAGVGMGVLAHHLSAREPSTTTTRAPLKQTPPKMDRDTPAGRWTLVKGDANGKHQPREIEPGQVWEFAGGKLTITHPDRETDEFEFTLDPKAKPRALDLNPTTGWRKGQKAVAIFQASDDELHVCLSWSQPAKRPKEFNSSGDKDNEDDRGRRLFRLVKADDPAVLQKRLGELDALRKGTDTPFAEVEKQGKELLAQFKKPAEQAKIYFMLAHVYGQSGIAYHPDRVTAYARLALKAERDPAARGWLHMYLGCAAEVDGTRRTFEEKRKAAAAAYLEGYKEVLALDLPAKAPELPVLGKLRRERNGDPAEDEELRKKQEAQLKARRKAEFVREMVDRRELYIGQLAQLYRRAPAADEELRQLAEQVLKDREAVKEFLAKVAQWKGAWEK